MKKQVWNEEQTEKLLKQLPQIKDKRVAEHVYQNILSNLQNRRKKKKWIAPTFASVAAFCIIMIISPFLLSNLTSEQESSSLMDSAKNAQMEISAVDNQNIEESKVVEDFRVEEKSNDVQYLSDEQETFVTTESEAGSMMTVGLTSGENHFILPISIKINEHEEMLEAVEEIELEGYFDELGPVEYALKGFEIDDAQDNAEIIIENSSEEQITGSLNGILFQNAIIETFRWHDYKNAELYTNDKAGIELSNFGMVENLEVKQELQKAYFLYQYNEQTLKLLVPSQHPYDTIEKAIEVMRSGEGELKPTILNNITIENIVKKQDQLEIQFQQDTKFQDNQQYVIMLESILLVAKEFGFKKVLFKGIDIERVGVLDVTKPIDVPFSPNPIEAN